MTSKKRTSRPVRDMIAPKEPLMVFRGQSAALLLPVVLGLMSLLATFFALQTTQKLFELQESIGLANSELTVFIPTTPGLTPNNTDPAVKRALDVLQSSSGLGRVEVLERQQARALVEDVLGDTISAQVPVPTIISVQKARRAALDISALREALDRAAPGALVDDNRALRDHLETARLEELTKGTGLVVAVLVVVSITAALVIGQSVDLQSGVIHVLYISGARDQIILSQFVGFALRSALLGAGLGGVAGWLLQLIYWPRVMSEPSTIFPIQVPVMILVIILLVVVSVLSARWNVLRKLKRTF
ncbi:MAG: FtsX-like permease family protein [Alphaproteobacteria bacterium]